MKVPRQPLARLILVLIAAAALLSVFSSMLHADQYATTPGFVGRRSVKESVSLRGIASKLATAAWPRFSFLRSWLSSPPPSPLDDIACPPRPASSTLRTLQINAEAKGNDMLKYEERATTTGCGGGLWAYIGDKEIRHFAEVIGRTLQLRSGISTVLDWGCGCGQMLGRMNEAGVAGLGVEVVAAAAAAANRRRGVRVCEADGTRLGWLPSDRFDAAFSFGSLCTYSSTVVFSCVVAN